jgi:membrane protease YdiL (CAAX protease family)
MFTEVTTYGILLLYFFLFFIAVYASSESNSGELKDVLTGKGEPGVLLNRLIAGIFFLGTGTLHILIKRNIDTGIFLPMQQDKLFHTWLIPAAAAIITGAVSAFKKITNHTSFTPSLPSSFLLSFGFVRTLFLIVYEFFFRGVLLFVMMEDFGTEAAVIINILLYVLIHWFNKIERTGAVPMGLVLCLATIYYNSVWPAVFIHVALALSHEFTLFSRYYLFTQKLRL